jgi:hypothetical protein
LEGAPEKWISKLLHKYKSRDRMCQNTWQKEKKKE